MADAIQRDEAAQRRIELAHVAGQRRTPYSEMIPHSGESSWRMLPDSAGRHTAR